VAVAVTAPTPRPLSTRPSNSPGSDGHARKTTPARTSSASAGISTRRRPYESERWPARNRLTATATAYTANTIVTISDEKRSRCAYSDHSGVGTVVNAIAVANAIATTANAQ
jgi:hypothetical protein